jgi:hypothetical protein
MVPKNGLTLQASYLGESENSVEKGIIDINKIIYFLDGTII